ncbi:MAG: hypothetical protein K2W96_13910 [Gemmataceae bacterium]|nr:hypothetical protein [Gemmataceae bacterium]
MLMLRRRALEALSLAALSLCVLVPSIRGAGPPILPPTAAMDVRIDWGSHHPRIALSDCGRLVAFFARHGDRSDDVVEVWDVPKRKLLFREEVKWLKHGVPILQFAPYGKSLVVIPSYDDGNPSPIRMLEVPSGKTLIDAGFQRWNAQDDVFKGDIWGEYSSKDDPGDGKWKLPDSVRMFGTPDCIALSRNGKFVAHITGRSKDVRVMVFDLTKLKWIRREAHRPGSTSR